MAAPYGPRADFRRVEEETRAGRCLGEDRARPVLPDRRKPAGGAMTHRRGSRCRAGGSRAGEPAPTGRAVGRVFRRPAAAPHLARAAAARGRLQDAGTGAWWAVGRDPPPAVRAGTAPGSAPPGAPARHRAGPRMARCRASGQGPGQRGALSRRALPFGVRDRQLDPRHPLVGAALLRPQTMTATPVRRCAVYTRKSSEDGLEQEFNSLQAQREACEAFIRSQRGEGWRLIETAYDDGGLSGGTLQRPALQRLFADIAQHRVDTVLVYKVDRLTRSLMDFAKIVELFDRHGVSFVAVTQQFNTTTSMGRLTLNILLSFAQFEREVIGERVRDKIAASKKKGLWMGGLAPLGYAAQDRKLIVVPEEAQAVRRIFLRYPGLGSVPRL